MQRILIALNTKAHELHIFFRRERKKIVYVRLTTVRMSVCNSSSQLTHTRGVLYHSLTLRDYKPNFVNKPTCRLISPTKSEIGSKAILDRIINKITRATRHLWSNGLKPLKTKKHHSFICSDIEEFYPSISQDLLNRVLDFASTYDITNDEETSCNTCKTFDPYAQTATLVKEGRYNIWRPNGQLRRCWNMRACRKPFLLSQLRNINIRLYRNDGLAISNATPRETDNRKFAEVFSMRRRKKLFRDGRGIFNHRRTISHNASSKKSSSLYAECTGKLTSSSALIRPHALKTHTTSSLPRTPLG